MTVLALIGAEALYLLFAWLLSAAIGSWLTNRKGYGDRLGLTLGLLLTVLGLLLTVLLPSRPSSAWAEEGPIPQSWRRALSPSRVLGKLRASRSRG